MRGEPVDPSPVEPVRIIIGVEPHQIDHSPRINDVDGLLKSPSPTTPRIDAGVRIAGAPAVIDTVLASARHGARLSIVAVHKKPVPVDFGPLLTSELTIALAIGYPTEIFEVTEDLIAHGEKYALIISDVLPYDQVERALSLAATPGAADKVVVTIP